jgi:hypothetical protein
MSLTAGSVSVNDVGVRTGSDMALALYDEQINALTEITTPPPKGGPVAIKQALARWCNHIALALAPYINTNIAGGGGGGDVSGPASSMDLAIAIYNGVTGKVIKDSGITIATLTAAVESYADGVGATVAALIEIELLLVTEPTTPNNTYTNTLAGLFVTQEKWVRTAGSTNIKTVDYTFTGSQLTTEVRKVFASDGTTILAQMTFVYSYSGLVLTDIAAVRNI